MRHSGKVIAGRDINLTISIGVAQYCPAITLEQTMKLADEALYHAKRTGRDRYHIAAAHDPVQVTQTSSIRNATERRDRRAVA
jgi:predicted signal transduction protein with EAL and GGDEF domain